MKMPHGCVGFLCLTLAGCANFNMLNRSTPLPDDGTAIHLDAPQRVTIANKYGWACSEPSPDALQAYASSLGVGFSRPAGESISIANALSGNAGSIGLRTQSITLMRDALYRICELYFNGAISKSAAVQLLQRSQDLTLGVLAIEQLTGAVVAQQVVMTGNSAALAAATINDTTKELEKAKGDEAAKKKALEAAEKALEAQTKAVADKKVAADIAKGKATLTQKDIDKLQPLLTEAKAKHGEAEAALASLRIDLKVLDVLIAGPTAAIPKMEAELKVLQPKTAAAKQAYDAAVKAKEDEETLKNLKEEWDQAKAAEEKLSGQLAQAKIELPKLRERQKMANDKLPAAETAVADAAKAVLPLQTRMNVLKADPDKMAADKAVAELASATEAQGKRKTEAEAAKTALTEAEEATQQIAKLGQTAVANSGANTTTAGQFSTSTNRYGISKDTVEALTEGTLAIVETVMNKGHMTDTCGVLLMAENPGMDRSLIELCTRVVLETLEVWKADARKKAAECESGECGKGLVFTRTPTRATVPYTYKPFTPDK